MGTSGTGSVLSASAFVGSLGINTHAAYGWGAYTNASLMIDDLRYLGITALRDTISTDPANAPVVDALAAAGYKIDVVVPSNVPGQGAAGLQQFLSSVDALAKTHPGSVLAVEGLNEADIQGFSYNGSSSLAAAAQFQSALYSAVKSDANLAGVPVYNMTLGLNNASNYAALGNLAGSSDYANAHAYVATTTPESYGLSVSLGLAQQAAAGRPIVNTESGYTTLASYSGLGVDQTAQAKSILTSVVEAFKDGVSQNYLYELLDTNSSANEGDPEAHFGLFNNDGSPKLAATAIHNLTTILADDGKGGHMPGASLGYTLSNLPSGGDSMVLAKTNGAYDLVVWAEKQVWNPATQQDIVNPAQSVTVQLDGVHSTISVYDPLGGTAPIATYTNVQSFQVPVSDHPLVIEIDAPNPQSVHAVVASVPAGSTVAETSAEFVSQISELSAVGTATSVALTDTHVLTVASEATMNYMIAHYGTVLSAITGGYSFAVTETAPTWSQTDFYSASGSLTSNEQSAYVNGVIAYDLVTNADGSTASSNFVSGVKTHMTVTYADHSQAYYSYGITGQSYVTEVQHFDASSALTSVVLINASGSMTNDQYVAGQLVSEMVTEADPSHAGPSTAAPTTVQISSPGSFGTIAHDTSSHGGEVYAFYDGLLGRQPDSLGIEYWAHQVDTGMSIHDVSQLFLQSAEGQSRYAGTNNVQFVSELYSDVLHRSGDNAGVNQWANFLNQGVSRADVAAGFVLSAEHASDLSSVLSSGVYTPDQNAAETARLYYGVLGRTPDSAGLDFWKGLLHDGISLHDVTQGIINTQEFQALGHSTDGAFIEGLYEGALGRPLDAGGSQFWGALLQHGVSRADVAIGIAESAEAQQHLMPSIETGWHLA